MAIGRITGSVLKSNLTRNGVDLAFETNLLYLDVTNSRIGIGTSEPDSALQVSGTFKASSITSTSTLSVTGSSTLDGITITDNTISTNASNADLELSANGSGAVKISGIVFPTADGSNGQVLQTDGSGNLTFAESSGGGGGNNTAVKTFEYNKLSTSSTVIDEFDVSEYRAAIYHIGIEDITNTLVGHTTVNVVHDSATAYMSQYDSNEDSANLTSYTVAISGTKVQLSASANAQSSHVNLRIYRVALGDHHETVANTNSKIIVSTTSIDSTATTIDQFTKTDIQGAKYYILIKNATNGDYQISEMNLVHDGTTVYFNDYGKTSTNANQYLATFSADISGATVNLKAIAGGGTEATATMYRIDLGSKTKLGEYDSVFYSKAGNVDSAVQTIDSFDVYEKRTAKYFINIGNAGDTEYQNSEITLTNNGSDAFITETKVRSGTTDLATFSADVSAGRVRLRMSGTSADNVIYLARMSMVSPAIYRASADTANNLYVSANNFDLTDTLVNFSGATGALILPKSTTGNRPTGVTGMLRYNTSTDTYERYDTTGWTNITTTATTSESSDTTVGEKTSISTTAVNIDTFQTSTFDSAFYLAVTRDEINNEVATAQISLVHNNTNAFVASGGIIQSGSNDQLTYSADVSGSDVRLRGTGISDVNSIKFYRIGLGDNTSAATTGNASTIINTDVDSATENLDTWAHATYRGAKYYISANNSSKTELQNIECLVVHDGTTAYITAFNDVYTGNNPLITLTADISGSDVRLRASGNEPNTAVKMYRIILSDSESDASGTNTNVVGAVTVSSSATQIDTFSSDSYTGVHYVAVGYNSSEPGTPASISEVFVVTDGSDAYVGNSQISTKGTDQLTFTATLSGTTVALKASSTSGSSTLVNAYRVHLLRSAAGASTDLQVLTTNTQTISGTKTFTGGVTIDNITINDTDISTSSNADLILNPGGTGKVNINGSYTLPSSDGTLNQVLQTDGNGTVTFGTVTAGAGGSNTQVQYNASGSLAGSSNLTFDGTTLTANTLRVTGNLTVDGTETIINTSTLSVEDNIIEINRNVSSNAGMPSISGIKINRGEGSTATEQALFWAWDETFADDGTTIYGNAGGAFTAFKRREGDTSTPGVADLVDIRANIVHATSTSAQYADLAEKYTTDQEYPVGTVMMVGGNQETTACINWGIPIGVVSDKPAYLMNASADGTPLALKGRVPIRVIGSITKGQALYADNNGTASTQNNGNLVGIALESSTKIAEKLIETVLKL